MDNRTLVVGIGSPHGDDRVGWVIAERIAELVGHRFDVRCARSPAELLDWLEGVVELHVCDAFTRHTEVGAAQCWDWPSPEIEGALFHGSHDFSLPAALALAEQLGRLPARVRIWGIAIGEGRGGDSMSLAVRAAVPEIVDRIRGALAHA
jgi:hydrogenase maturation protease